MKKIYLFAVLLLSLCTTSLSAKEWIHDTKSAQGQIQYGYNMHAPFIDLSPLTFEYKATYFMQFQFSVGDIGLIQVDADGIEKKYYSFVASFNTFSTRMIFRF